MHNTFTYRHSELPSIPPELQAGIAAIDVLVAELILKSQGNYRALEQLAEILDDCLDSCKLNLNSIRIIPDDTPVPAVGTMTNLPIGEQSAIFSTALFSYLLLVALQRLTGDKMKDLVSDVSNRAVKEMGEISDEQITASLARVLEKKGEHSECKAFFIEIPIKD